MSLWKKQSRLLPDQIFCRRVELSFRIGFSSQSKQKKKSITRRSEMRPRTMVVIGIGAVAALAAIVLLVGWLGLGWFKAPATPAMTEPTPEVRVVEQTRIVFVEQTTTPGAPTAPPSAPP